MSADHCGFVTRLSNLAPHDNADKLQLCVVFNNQVVISKDMYEGQMVLYVPTDMRLSEEFCVENKLLKSLGGYIDDKKRNVTTVKLRGQRSDGLVLPIECLSAFTDVSKLKPGDRISTLNGKEIITKYVPAGRNKNRSEKSGVRKTPSKKLAERFPLFKEHVDTLQFDFNLDVFKPYDEIIITEKLEGTSGRTSYNDTIVDKPQNWVQKKLNQILRKPTPTEIVKRYVTGTRRTVLTDFNGGFYGSDLFRKTFHDDLEQNDKLYKGETIYYEIVGFLPDGRPIMPSHNNKKVNDKEFQRIYGEQTVFSYGCEPKKCKMFVYRMTMNTGEIEIEYPWQLVKLRCEQMGLETVPELDHYMFTTVENTCARVEALLSKPSVIDGSHIAEGVCVRRNNATSFSCLKKKCWEYKALISIYKSEDNEPDIEEQESAVEGGETV